MQSVISYKKIYIYIYVWVGSGKKEGKAVRMCGVKFEEEDFSTSMSRRLLQSLQINEISIIAERDYLTLILKIFISDGHIDDNF